MAVSTIGSGQTYETIKLWEDAKDGLAQNDTGQVTDAAEYDEDVLTFDGKDSSLYSWILEGVGSGKHNGTFGSGATITNPTGAGHVIYIAGEEVEIRDLEIISHMANSANSDEAIRFDPNNSATTLTVKRCLLWFDDSSGTDSTDYDGIYIYQSGNIIVENSVLYNFHRAGIHLQNYTGTYTITIKCRNVTIDNCGEEDSIYAGCYSWKYTGGTQSYETKNCVGTRTSASGHSPWYSDSTFVGTNNASDETGTHMPDTNEVLSITPANEFDTLGSNYDLIDGAGDLYNSGIGPGSDADIPTTDIVGRTRSGTTCSIGAFEYSAGGTTTSTSTTTTSTTTTSTSTTTTSTSTSTSTSTTTTLAPSGGLAFGEENPTNGEIAITWQTFSDGAAGIPTISGDSNWGKMALLPEEEGRSRVYNFGNSSDRTYSLVENLYGTGSGTHELQIRGSTSIFAQDDASPAWEDYTSPILRNWQWVQVRASTVTKIYGLQFPSNTDSPTTGADSFIAIQFEDPQSNGLPIWGPSDQGTTWLWEYYPIQQTGYYVTFWWSENSDSFSWDTGTSNTYYGCHPYPPGSSSGTSHYWEIAGTSGGGDFTTTEGGSPLTVVKGQWYTQAFRVYPHGTKTCTLYIDLPSTATSNIIENEALSDWGETDPPNPAVTFGDSPWWSAYQHERMSGILGRVKIFNKTLSESDILAEAADMSQLVTTDGQNNIWWGKNNFSSVDDLTCNYGTGRAFSWASAGKATLVEINPAE